MFVPNQTNAENINNDLDTNEVGGSLRLMVVKLIMDKMLVIKLVVIFVFGFSFSSKAKESYSVGLGIGT